MATKKKYKRMTNAEKNLKKKIRQELREKGVLPPVKQRLNRNKFASEVKQEFNESFSMYEDGLYLLQAIGWSTPPAKSNVKIKISSEEIGVLKVLKLAMEIKKFTEEKRRQQGESNYTYGELFDKVVTPIKNL